jgi:hypothetical protein
MIAVVNVPGSYALEPRDLFRFLMVGGTDQMSLERSRCAQDALKLHARDDIGVPGVLVGDVPSRIIRLETGRQDDRAGSDGPLLLSLFEIDRVGGTEFLAGSAFPLLEINAFLRVNGVLEGNRLGVLDVNRLAFDQPLVEGVIHLFGTFFSTGPAADALVHPDIAGVFEDLHLEISGGSFHISDFAEGQQFDIEMPADLDQFGRDNSHCAVVGGKGLVELCHHPADGRPFLQQVDVES